MQQAGSQWDPAFPYPATAADRATWIAEARPAQEPRERAMGAPAGFLWEDEWQGGGTIQHGLTVFIANRECPWRCVMCDLWREASPVRVGPDDVLGQVDAALSTRGRRRMEWLKLYNGGSFFDAGAIPPSTHEGIALRCQGIQRLVVECHPALVGGRVDAFRRRLPCGVKLEVALGLETVHPRAHEGLNKRTTPLDFAKAAAWLRGLGVGVRLFLLTRPPFIPQEDALGWLLRSVDFALDAGADPVVVIPTRGGNGAMERLRAAGEWEEGPLEWLEHAVLHGRARRGGRVLADIWDLERRAASDPKLRALVARLARLNRGEDLGRPPGAAQAPGAFRAG